MRYPGTKRRAPTNLMTGLEQCHRGIVVDRLGVHRADQTHFIGKMRRAREQFTQPHAALSVLLEFEVRGCNGEPLLARGHSSQTLAVADRIRQILVELILQPRLVIKQVQL